jgi:hypothetical protein
MSALVLILIVFPKHGFHHNSERRRFRGYSYLYLEALATSYFVTSRKRKWRKAKKASFLLGKISLGGSL